MNEKISFKGVLVLIAVIVIILSASLFRVYVSIYNAQVLTEIINEEEETQENWFIGKTNREGTSHLWRSFNIPKMNVWSIAWRSILLMLI